MSIYLAEPHRVIEIDKSDAPRVPMIHWDNIKMI